MSVQFARQFEHHWHPDFSGTNARPISSFDRTVAAAGTVLNVPRDSEIFGEAEPADYFYQLLSGAVRTYKVLVDGRRQIDSFSLSGDFFGFATDSHHAFSAEAVADCRILAIKRAPVMLHADDDRELALHLWSMTGNELKRVQSHVLLLIKTARERVAAFLLEMAERMPDEDQVELPMGRQDIADYLGLTIETVSRMLTDLEKRGAIHLPNSRHVVLRDRAALAAQSG